MRSHLKIWEAALLIALSAAFCYSLTVKTAQEGVAEELIRLHVVAASDSERDQSIKLLVRDGVLSCLENRLSTAQSARDARDIIAEDIPEIESAANRVLCESGCGYTASASLKTESFPTRVYGSFALPAGEYTSLRVTIGEGKGHNWWCVVFPPLCASASETTAAVDALSEGSARLITTEDAEYTVRFRIAEWLAWLREALGG